MARPADRERMKTMDENKPHFKKGDILENGWTTERNAFHLSVFLKCGNVGGQKTYDCISCDGRILNHLRDGNKLTAVGHMKEFDDFVSALKKLDRRGKDED